MSFPSAHNASVLSFIPETSDSAHYALPDQPAGKSTLERLLRVDRASSVLSEADAQIGSAEWVSIEPPLFVVAEERTSARCQRRTPGCGYVGRATDSRNLRAIRRTAMPASTHMNPARRNAPV